MIVAVKFTLYCFFYFTLLVLYESVASAQVIEQYSPQNVEQVLQLSRRSIDDLLKWDRALRRRKYEQDKRFLLLYKRADTEDDEEDDDASDSYNDEDERKGNSAVTRHAVSKKTSIRGHKGVNHRSGKHYSASSDGSKKTHIIHSLKNLSPIMESERAAKIVAVSESAIKPRKDEEYEGSEVPVILKQFHNSWHGDKLSKFSNQVVQHNVEKVSDDRKDKISKEEPHGGAQHRIVNAVTPDDDEDGDEASGAAQVADGSGDASNEKSGAIKEAESHKHHAEEEKNIEAKIVNADGKSAFVNAKGKDDLKDAQATVTETKDDDEPAETPGKEDGADAISNKGDTNTTSPKVEEAATKGKSARKATDTGRNTEYRKIKHVATFSPKSFSDMIVEDVMKNKGDNRRLPARNTNLETVSTMHQPVTAQRILPFLGNRQTSKDFRPPVVSSKGTQKYNKLIKPRHLHHHHHHSHRIYTSEPSNITSILSNNSLLKRRVVWPEPALPLPAIFTANRNSHAIIRKVIPPTGRSALQQSIPAGRPLIKGVVNLKGNMVGSKGLDNIPEHGDSYIPARLSMKPFVPPSKPTIYDKILKSVAKMGEKQGIKPMTPLDTNKASAFLNSYYRHVKELSQDPQYADSIFSNNTNEAAAQMVSIPQLMEAARAANITQPKQAIPYRNYLTNATSYGGNLGLAAGTNNIGYSTYSSPEPADRRSLKNIKKSNSKSMLQKRQPLLKCYKGHCNKVRKYADVSGSKKDVLIGKLVTTMDPEDQGGGELDVAEINGAQLFEDSPAVDSDDNPPPEIEEENEEEKKDELKGSKRDFTNNELTNSDLLKAITSQQEDASSQAPISMEDAESTEPVGDDTRMLGATPDTPEIETAQAEARSLPVSDPIPPASGVNEMEMPNVEETSDGLYGPLPAERKSSVVQSTNSFDQMDAIKRPVQIKPKYYANQKTDQREMLGDDKYIDIDDFGRRRKSETGIPLGEIEVDNPNVPVSEDVEGAPQGSAFASLEDNKQAKSIDINDFQGNIQEIENKEFQGYLQTIKQKEAAKERDFQDYIQSFKNKEAAVSQKAAKKDKYAVPQVVPVNEYQQESTRGTNYGVSVTRSAPYKSLHQHVGAEYPRKISNGYRTSHGLPMGEYGRAEKKTLDYSFAKSPAVNEYSVSNEEGNDYVVAHNKKSSFDEVGNTFNPLKGNIEKEIPNDLSSRYTGAEHASPKDGGGGEEVAVNYETDYSRETEQPVNRISNAEVNHARPSYTEKQTIEYAPSDERIPVVKEVINEVDNPSVLGAKYGFIDDTEKNVNSVRRTVNNYNRGTYTRGRTYNRGGTYNRGETAIPYTASNNGIENFNYERKQYISPARASFLARQRSAYLAKKRYQATVAARIAAKKQLARRTATPERLMAMTQNPRMLSRLRLGPLGPGLNAKSSPVGNLERELNERENESFELSKLVKGQIQDPTSFEQQNLLKGEQNRKAMVEHAMERAQEKTPWEKTPWENSFLSGVDRPLPLSNEISRSLEERTGLLGGGFMNFGKRNVDGYNEVFTTNEAKTLIPVMKNKRLNNMSTILQRKTSLALGAVRYNKTSNATKKMEVPSSFSDLGSVHEENANLLSGVDTPLPIREKEPIISVSGDTKNKISSVDFAAQSKINLLKKLAATKEDLLAAGLADRRREYKEKSDDVPSAVYFHKEGSISDDITPFGGHTDLEESTAHERKLSKMNPHKQDNEMNIVGDESMTDKKDADLDVEGDIGEDRKLADIIAHATRKNHEGEQAKSPSSEKKADPGIKERNETVAMTGAAVLTAEPYKAGSLKEHTKHKETPEPQLVETEEKIFPKVDENDLNEATDSKPEKSEEKKPKDTTQKNPDKAHAGNMDLNDVKKLKELENQLKNAEEQKLEKVGSIQMKLKEMAGLDGKDGKEGKNGKDEQPGDVPKEGEVKETTTKPKETDINETKEKHAKKLVSNDGKNKQDKHPHDLESMEVEDKEIAKKNAEKIEHEEKKAKEFAAKEWQKHHGGDKANGFTGKDGKEDLDEKNVPDSTSTLKIKETQKQLGKNNVKEGKNKDELGKGMKGDVLIKETRKEFAGSKEKDVTNKESQKEFDENTEKEVSLKELQQQFDESKGKDDEHKEKEVTNKENPKEFAGVNSKEGKEKENENQLDGSKEKAGQKEFQAKKVKETNKEEEEQRFRDDNDNAENSMVNNNERNDGREQDNVRMEKKKAKYAMKGSAQNVETNKDKQGGNKGKTNKEETGEGTKPIKPDDKKEDGTRAKELDLKLEKVPTTATITIEKGEVNVQDKDDGLTKTPTKEEAAGMTEKEKENGSDQKVDKVSSEDKEELTGMMEVEKEKNLSDQKAVTLTGQEIKNHKGVKKPTSVSEFKENAQRENEEKDRPDENKLGEEAEQNSQPVKNAQKGHDSKSVQNIEAQENEMKSSEKEAKDTALEEEGKINEFVAKNIPVTDSEKENVKEATDKTSESAGGKVKTHKSFDQSKNKEESSRVQSAEELQEVKAKDSSASETESDAKLEKTAEKIAEKDAEREKLKEAEKEAMKEIEADKEMEAEKEEVKMNEKGAEKEPTNGEWKNKDIQEMDTEKSAAQPESADEGKEVSGESTSMMIASKMKHQEAKEQEVGYDKDVDRKRKGRKDKSASITEDEGNQLKEASESADTITDGKESKVKDTMKNIAASESPDDNKINENEQSLESNGESENKELGSSESNTKAPGDPEEKKLKELLNKKVEEIMTRFRKEKETGQPNWTGNDQSNMNNNEEMSQQEGQHTAKGSEESETNDENAKPIENSAPNDGKSTKEGIEDYEKTSERQEIASEVNSDLKQDIDDYHNRTDSASTKDVIEGMSNPFADIGSLPDGPAYNHNKEKDSKDINAELAEIIRSQKTSAETNLHAETSKTQHASARDSFPKFEEAHHGRSSSQVSKRGFYRYTDAKRRKE